MISKGVTMYPREAHGLRQRRDNNGPLLMVLRIKPRDTRRLRMPSVRGDAERRRPSSRRASRR
jgi:hypothetical protein